VLAARDSLRITIQLLQTLEIELDKKLNYLLALYNYMQGMEAHMKAVIEATHAVTINLRGTLFVIETEHLVLSSNVFFHILIYSDPVLIRGHYFIDRPFEGFDRIVNAMRGEELSYEGLNDYEVQCINDNLKYLQLPFKRFERKFGKCSKLISCTQEYGIIKVFCALQDGQVCTGSNFNEIIIWDVTSNLKRLKTLPMLENTHQVVVVLQLSDGKLCTVSSDKVIRVWNLQICKCETTLIGHEDIVVAIVEYSPTQICSAANDKTIGLWNLTSKTCDSIYRFILFQIRTPSKWKYSLAVKPP
jgi:hypothetical protein